MANLLYALSALAYSFPISTFFALVFVFLLTVRVRTGYAKTRLQNETSAAEKEIPILPYWIPYLGQALGFAWDNDTLLTKGRLVTYVLRWNEEGK